MGKNRIDGVGSNASTPINNSVKDSCCSFEHLYEAMQECKQNVMWKDSTAGFVKNGLKNCAKLHDELMSGKYHLSQYNVFTVHEKKTRVIVSTRIRDRVVQRSLCNNYLYHELTKGFIYDNAACLKGKGTDFARNRLKCHLQRFYRKHGMNGYCLKIDIHNYFGSTRHDVAKAAVAKRIEDEWARQMVFDIIDSFKNISPDVGMGLGSQITQLVELAVLDDLDHEIKERLHIKHYVRYMDDLVLVHEDKEYLQRCLSTIQQRLSELGLELNKKKTGIQPLSHGISFLGFSYRLHKGASVEMRLLTGKASKERTRLKKLARILEPDKFNECYTSWRSFTMKGDTYRLLQGMDVFHKELYDRYYEDFSPRQAEPSAEDGERKTQRKPRLCRNDDRGRYPNRGGTDQ